METKPLSVDEMNGRTASRLRCLGQGTRQHPMFPPFAGTAYLAINNHPQLLSTLSRTLHATGAGAGASRVTTGESEFFLTLESRIAELVGLPAVTFLPGTSLAAFLALDLLRDRIDLCLLEDQAHHSTRSAVQWSGLGFSIFSIDADRGDPGHLSGLLGQAAAAGKRPLVCVDSVHPVTGRVFPYHEFQTDLESSAALLLLDDSHGFGVLGNGRGAPRELGIDLGQLIYIGSFSKALGMIGGFVATQLWRPVDARNSPFFSTNTPLPPFVAAGILEAIEIGIVDPGPRDVLSANIEALVRAVKRIGLMPTSSTMPIQALSPLPCPQLQILADQLRSEGIQIPLVRYPTSASAPTLRVAVTAAHTPPMVAAAIARLGELLDDCR